MKILLITNYWLPYNHPGTFRWYNFGKYIDFDVLTSKHKKGFKDETLENGRHRVIYRKCFKLPAFFSGIFLGIYAMALDYDLYIFTSPPESLIFSAWILQKRKKVILDMRDAINRPNQFHKWFIPIYKYFYKKVKNVTVAWKLIDDKEVICHGHDSLKPTIDLEYPYIFKGKFNHKEYLKALEIGGFPDLSKKPANYVCSSWINLKHLWGNKIFPSHLNKELLQVRPASWKHQAKKYEKYILKLFNKN